MSENLADLTESQVTEAVDNLDFEPTFVRTQDTFDYEPDKTTQKNWQAVRDECRSGGAMDERCNIVAASNGNGRLNVVAKRLECGCILIPDDAEEIGNV